MNKKISAYFIFILLIILLLSPFTYAADAKIRMVNVQLPDVTAELSGKVLKSDVSSVSLGKEKLKVEETDYSKKTTKLVYMLVDISTSMSQSALNSLKPELIKYAKSLSKKTDKFVLMTFGDSVTMLLKGGENNAEIESAINSIVCNSNNTSFYTALNKVFKDSEKESKYERKFAIVVSDGEDLDNGNSSQQEVIDNYKTHRLPVYAMCQSQASKSSSDGFGYIARSSGGELVNYSSSNASQGFSQLKGYFENVTVVNLISQSKKSAGLQDLAFNLRSNKITQEVLVKAKADKIAPKIKTIKYYEETNSFKITFSEDVENADKLSSFKVMKNNKELTIVSVSYKSKTAILNMEKTIYSGEYKFKLSSITDASDNLNKLAKSEYTETITAKPVILKVLAVIGIILIPVSFLLAIFLILLFLKKKKNVKKIKDLFIGQVEEEQYESVHIKEKKGLSVNFYIDAADGTYHNIKYNLISSVIVGRTEMCDLRIDDSMLSSQHFAIERVENGIAAIDLSSKNGTFINGVQIHSKTFIKSGDRISAGNSVIRIEYKERDDSYDMS